MEKIKIQTTQNVEIEYPIATILDRILAYVIDIVIIILFLLLTVIAMSGTMAGSTVMFIIYTAITLIVLCYDLLFEILNNGQSPGKMIMKIRVLMLDGSTPSMGAYLLRWILRPIDTLLTSGLGAILTILLTGRGQRIGDISGGTTVIKLKENTSLEDTILSSTPKDYKPVIPEVSLLSDSDISTLKELIVANSEVKVSDTILKANMKAKELLEQKMNIKSEKSALQLFHIILRDYNGIHGKA